MARAPKAKAEPAEEAAGAGHNGPTEEVFLQHLRAVITSNQMLEDAKSARQKIRKLAKADGVELKKLDSIITMMDWEPGETREHFSTLHQYAVWARLPVGTQLDLFDGTPEAARPALDWEAKGFMAATTGKGTPGTPPGDCPADQVQAWMTGWNDGQVKNAPNRLDKAA